MFHSGHEMMLTDKVSLSYLMTWFYCVPSQYSSPSFLCQLTGLHLVSLVSDAPIYYVTNFEEVLILNFMELLD